MAHQPGSMASIQLHLRIPAPLSVWTQSRQYLPRASNYPLLDSKYHQISTIRFQLMVVGRSGYIRGAPCLCRRPKRYKIVVLLNAWAAAECTEKSCAERERALVKSTFGSTIEAVSLKCEFSAPCSGVVITFCQLHQVNGDLKTNKTSNHQT